MSNNLIIRIAAVVVALVFVVGSWATTGTADFGLLRFFSAAVFITTLVVAVWDGWAWKLQIAQKFSTVPRNISGTWETTLESFWINPETGNRIDPKTVYMVVRQTSSTVSVTLISNESKSRSSTARVVNEDGTWLLHYLYTNEPGLDAIHRSPIHHGSGVLTIAGNPAKRLSGSYWTDRETKGLLRLDRRSPKHADDFEEAPGLFAST